jgi:hypothetical protein
MKKTIILLLILVLTLLTSLFVGVQTGKAQNASSGIIILPLNHYRYTSNFLSLEITFKTVFYPNSTHFGSDEYYFITYSIDGGENIRIPSSAISYEISDKNQNLFYDPNTLTAIVELPRLDDGYHTLTVNGKEPSIALSEPGKYYYRQGTVVFAINTPPPTVANLSIKNQTYKQDTLQLNFTVDKPTSWIGYSLDEKENTNIVTIAGNTTLTGLSNGLHNVTVYAKDTFGSVGTSETVNFTVAVAPVVSFLSFESSTFDTSWVPLNFTVERSFSKIMYCLDGQANVTISGNSTLNCLQNGEHNITVYATDDAGNVGASEAVFFSVEVPFSTNLALPLGVSLAVVGVCLLLYYRQRKSYKR